MKKVKVRIYKDPSQQGGYIDPKRDYLKKAAYGMEVGGAYADIEQTIIDQLKESTDVETIIDDLMSQYGLSYFDAADQVNDIVDLVVKNEVKAEEEMDLVPEPEVKKPPLYTLGETSEEVEGAGWEDDETEEDDLSLGRKGGSMGKKKFVKTIVRGLRKAAEGMQQDVSNSASITDMSVGGRESKINDFRRGIKDLGNEYYAKEIYKSTKNLADQTSALPPIVPNGIAAYGMEVQQEQQDIENPMHHLGVYGDMVGNIFKQPYNQVQGTAFQNMPQAKRGMEQRQMNRAAKDFRNMFGDVAAGYSGVPGMPNYLQIISPNIIQNPQGASQTTQGQSGPLIDLSFKKGPWWTGKREWTAKGVPMGMFGAPGGRSTGYASSWNTTRTYPGEIIRDKVRTFNNAADPSKVGVTPKATDQNKQAALAAFTTDKPVTDAQGVPLTSDGSNMMWGQQGLPAEKPQVMREFAEEQVDPLTGLYTPASNGPIANTFSIEDTGLNNNPEANSTATTVEENKIEQQLEKSPIVEEDNIPLSNSSPWSLTSNTTGSQTEEFCYPGQSCYKLSDDQLVDRDIFNDLPRALSIYGSKNKASWLTDNADGYPTNLDLSKVTREEAKEAIKAQLPKNELSRINNLDEYIDKWLKFQQDNQKAYGNTNYADLYDYDNPESPKYADWLNVSGTANAQNPYDIFGATSVLDFQDYANGGPVMGVGPDAQGNLQRFVYGGNELPISPIVAYDNNDIQSKNVDDPFMFRNGGLYRFAGEDDSQVAQNPYTLTNPVPGQSAVGANQTAEFTRYNPNATATSNFAAFNEMKKRGIVQGNYNPNQSYDMSNVGASTTTNTNTNTNTNTTTQNQNVRQGYYPTAGTPLQQIKAMFSPIKKDFTWARQTDFPRTADGQIYQPGAGYVQGQPGTTAGYMPSEIKYEKGPWWSGKKTMTVKNSWFDPTKPMTGTNQPGSFTNAQGPVADPNAKGVVDANQNTSTTTNNVQASGSNAAQPIKSVASQYGFSEDDWDNMSWKEQTDIMNGASNAGSMKTLPATELSTSSTGQNQLQSDPNLRPSDPNAYVQGEYGDVMTDINELVPEAQAEYDAFLKTNPSQEQIDSKMNELLSKRNAQIDQNTANENRQEANAANANSYSRNPMMMGAKTPNAQTPSRSQLSTPPTTPNAPQPSGAQTTNTQPTTTPPPVAAPAATTLQSFTGTSDQDNFNSTNLPDRAQQILANRSGNIDSNPSYAGSQGARPSENISQLVANNPAYRMPAGSQQEVPNDLQNPGVRNFPQYTGPFEGAAANDETSLYGTMNGMGEGSMRNKQIQAKNTWVAAQAKLAEQKRQAQVQAQQQQQQQGNFANGMSNSGVQKIAGRVQNSNDLGVAEKVAAGKVYKMWENLSPADKKKAGGFDKWANANGYGKLVKQYGGTPEYMAYGGYMPTFDPGGQFSGSGPSDPNSNSQRGGMGQGLTGPCTEFEVQDPNSPCYDPNYKPGVLGAPKDFTTTYDIETARTFDPQATLNLKKAGAYGIEKAAAIGENIYNQTYLNNNTGSDNMRPTNQIDYGGGYSGLNQRIMSKGQGAGSTGFNGVVGNAAFVKKGGELNFKEGGVYDLTQEQIGKILAAGGQIKFIN